jgi:ribosomal-protein-serine acetyltransferase
MLKIEVDKEIHLRVPSIEDAPEYFAVLDNNRDYISVYDVSRTNTRSIEDAEKVIARWMKAADEGTSFQFLIEYRGAIVGSLGAMNLKEPERTANLGYWLSEDVQGRGIMTRSCRAIVRHLFEELEMNCIEVWAAITNIRSRAIPERLGFKLDGLLRERVLENGQHRDAAVYSMLAREWTPAQIN